jgi:hypothetical protein
MSIASSAYLNRKLAERDLKISELQTLANAGAANTVPATGVQVGTLNTGVTLSASQVNGFNQATLSTNFLQNDSLSVPRSVEGKLRDIINVKDFGAIGDGVVDDTAALLAADTAALNFGLPIHITSTLNITTPVVIHSLIADTLGKIFTTNNNVTVASGQVIRPEWWGADYNNILDSSPAFSACLSNAMGRTVQLSGGYKLLNPISVNYLDKYGLTICGNGATLTTVGATNNKCFLNFDELTSGRNALTFIGVRGLNLKNFFVSHKTYGGGGVAIWLTQLDMFRITCVDIESNTGLNGGGFKFGNIDGVDCAFMGVVESCKVFSNGGRSFGVYPACTSITFINCYQIGGYFYNRGSYYTTYTTCASEGSLTFGYILEGVTNSTFIQCAGEANSNGVFWIKSGCSSVNIFSPFGAGNNTSNTAVTGDLVFIDGSNGTNSNILITSPTSLNSGLNTISNIGAIGINGYTEVQNIYSANLPKGIGGSQVWKTSQLVTTGDYETINFSPTISNWSNNGTPRIVANLVKKGKLLNFIIKIIPTISIESVYGMSYISLPVMEWGGMLTESISTIVDLGTPSVSYNCAAILADGTINLPSFGPLYYPIIISGAVIIK